MMMARWKLRVHIPSRLHWWQATRYVNCSRLPGNPTDHVQEKLNARSSCLSLADGRVSRGKKRERSSDSEEDNDSKKGDRKKVGEWTCEMAILQPLYCIGRVFFFFC